MRIVDADSLREVLIKFQYTVSPENMNEACVRAVDYAPTLDVGRIAPKPRWILDRLHHYKCSACGAQWGRALNMNYCPTCGRYMEGRDPDDCRYERDTAD